MLCGLVKCLQRENAFRWAKTGGINIRYTHIPSTSNQLGVKGFMVVSQKGAAWAWEREGGHRRCTVRGFFLLLHVRMDGEFSGAGFTLQQPLCPIHWCQRDPSPFKLFGKSMWWTHFSISSDFVSESERIDRRMISLGSGEKAEMEIMEIRNLFDSIIKTSFPEAVT